MDIQFDPHDAAVFTRTLVAGYHENQRTYETKPKARQALICTINDIWPDSKKKSALRHAVIEALLGRPIESQNDLKWHETKTLLEVLHDEDFTGICWRALQVYVEGDLAGEPWSLQPTRLL